MNGVYNKMKYDTLKKLIDLSGDTFKVILLDNTYSFDADHNTYADVSAKELPTAGGYTAGGVTLGSPTVTEDDANDKAVFDGADVEWTSASFTTHYAVIYNSTVSDHLICCIDFGADKTVASGTFKIQWNADGIITLA